MSAFTPIEFQRKWSGNKRKERSASQEHFMDICRLIGHPTPARNRWRLHLYWCEYRFEQTYTQYNTENTIHEK